MVEMSQQGQVISSSAGLDAVAEGVLQNQPLLLSTLKLRFHPGKLLFKSLDLLLVGSDGPVDVGQPVRKKH